MLAWSLIAAAAIHPARIPGQGGRRRAATRSCSSACRSRPWIPAGRTRIGKHRIGGVPTRARARKDSEGGTSRPSRGVEGSGHPARRTTATAPGRHRRVPPTTNAGTATGSRRRRGGGTEPSDRDEGDEGGGQRGRPWRRRSTTSWRRRSTTSCSRTIKTPLRFRGPNGEQHKRHMPIGPALRHAYFYDGDDTTDNHSARDPWIRCSTEGERPTHVTTAGPAKRERSYKRKCLYNIKLD